MTQLTQNLEIAKLRMKAATTQEQMVSAMNAVARYECAIREYNATH